MKELEKLRKLLEENNIDYTKKSVIGENDGIDIVYKDYEISVISHPFSYGGNKGFLTADETLKEITTLGGIENGI